MCHIFHGVFSSRLGSSPSSSSSPWLCRRRLTSRRKDRQRPDSMPTDMEDENGEEQVRNQNEKMHSTFKLEKQRWKKTYTPIDI